MQAQLLSVYERIFEYCVRLRLEESNLSPDEAVKYILLTWTPVCKVFRHIGFSHPIWQMLYRIRFLGFCSMNDLERASEVTPQQFFHLYTADIKYALLYETIDSYQSRSRRQPSQVNDSYIYYVLQLRERFVQYCAARAHSIEDSSLLNCGGITWRDRRFSLWMRPQEKVWLHVVLAGDKDHYIRLDKVCVTGRQIYELVGDILQQPRELCRGEVKAIREDELEANSEVRLRREIRAAYPEVEIPRCPMQVFSSELIAMLGEEREKEEGKKEEGKIRQEQMIDEMKRKQAEREAQYYNWNIHYSNGDMQQLLEDIMHCPHDYVGPVLVQYHGH